MLIFYSYHVALHLMCSSSLYKDNKSVPMFGYKHVIHQWTVQLTEVADQPEEIPCCSYCEEPCSGSFLGGSPGCCCMWCQQLVYVTQAFLLKQVRFVTSDHLNT